MTESVEWLREESEWLMENPASQGLLLALVHDDSTAIGKLALDAIRQRGWFDAGDVAVMRGDETDQELEKALTYTVLDATTMADHLISMFVLGMADNTSGSYLDGDEFAQALVATLGVDATWWSNGYDPHADATAFMGITNALFDASICGRGNGYTFLAIAFDKA